MLDFPCKKFSDVLSTAFTHLMLRDLAKPPTPDNVVEFLNSLIDTIHKTNTSNGVVLRFGITDNPSEMLRRVSKDHYELYLNIEFPFKLTPIIDEVRSGCVMLQANAEVDHPALIKGFLDRKAIVEWLFRIFSSVKIAPSVLDFRRNCTVWSSNDLRVTFLPVLEFTHSQWPLASPGTTANCMRLQAHPWYAVSHATRPLDSRSFVVWAPDWERCILDTHQHSRRLLRLFDALAHNYDINIENIDLVIKTIMLQEVHNLPHDLGDSMIAFLEAVVGRLKEGTVNSFLVDSINVLQFEKDMLLEENYEYLNKALMELKGYKIMAQKFNGSNNDDDGDANDSYKSWMETVLSMFVRIRNAYQ